MREIETEKDLAVAVIFVHSKPMLNAEFWNLGQFGVYWFSHVVKRRSPKNDSGSSENACKSKKPQEQSIQHHRYKLPIFNYLFAGMTSSVEESDWLEC